MHYYQHHIGDFLADAGSLPNDALGAYMRLLWRYYSDESPIRGDLEDIAFDICTPPETVRQLLRRYFYESPDGWRNKRCDEEIAKYHAKADKAAASANARWGRARTMRTQCGRNANASISDANQQPITNNQKKDQKKKPAARPAPVFVPAPDWLNPNAWAEWCQYRKGKRWGESAQRYSLDELDKLRKEGHDPPAVIRQSIAAGWTGLFPLKYHGARNETHRNLSAVERVRAAAIAGELADRAAHRGYGSADSLGPDDGNLRPPLDL